MSTFYDALQSQYNYIASILPLIGTSSIKIDGSDIATSNSNLAIAIADLSNSVGMQNNVLTQQENVQRILDREKARLDYKQNSMDTVISGQKRVSELNHSYTEKYKAYNQIMYYTFIFFVFIIIIIILSYLLPEAIILLLYIILIIFYTIYLYNALNDIWKRDTLNFDKLGSQSGLLLNEGQSSSSSKRYNNSNTVDFGNLGYCMGKDCCAEGTYFDVSSGTCLVGSYDDSIIDVGGSSFSAFTTIEEAYKKNDISNNIHSINSINPVNPIPYTSTKNTTLLGELFQSSSSPV